MILGWHNRIGLVLFWPDWLSPIASVIRIERTEWIGLVLVRLWPRIDMYRVVIVYFLAQANQLRD